MAPKEIHRTDVIFVGEDVIPRGVSANHGVLADNPYGNVSWSQTIFLRDSKRPGQYEINQDQQFV